MIGIDRVLQSAVENGAVPNVVGIVANRDGVVYEGSAGTVSQADDSPVNTHTEYRIMSMTKIVTTAAALQQVEKGALELDAPVEEYFPDFANRKVLVGFDGDKPQMREPASKATVRQLMTHTAGQGYMFFNGMLNKWEELTGYPGALSGARGMLDSPLLHDPGTAFEYGINTDVLGAVTEAAGGKALDKLVIEGVLQPLGMNDTTYFVNDEQRKRTVTVQIRNEDGAWGDTEIDYAQEPEIIPGGHGLYSTASDYIKFQCMLLNRGELDGTRVLQESTVMDMFQNQIGELDFPAHIETALPFYSADFAPGSGWKWGLGLMLNTTDLPGMRKAGSGAWAGLCNTHFWVDPQAGIAASIYSQTLPFVEPGAFKMYQDFEAATYAEFA